MPVLTCTRVDPDAPTDPKLELLRTALEVAVPMWVQQVKYWTDARQLGEARRCASVVASHGDDLQFRGKYTAEAFNALAESLAIGALLPGGVIFVGLRWEVKQPAGIKGLHVDQVILDEVEPS